MRISFLPIHSVLRWFCLVGFAWPVGSHAQVNAPVAPAPPPKPATDPVRALLDLPYVKDGVERQRLDLYLPRDNSSGNQANKRPLIVWIHGGAWESGSKQNSPAKPLVARGYAVASINYRLSAQAVYPAQIEDCKAAVRWLRAHAGEYGIDPTRIGAWGASAGGHLVALLGTTAGTRQFDVGENLDQSSAVKCVLDWFGPTDFLVWGDPPATAELDTPTTPVARLLGGTVLSHEKEARLASPLYFVDKQSAPFLIMHGDKDPTVPLQQSQEFHSALQKAGVESTLKVSPGVAHSGSALLTKDNQVLIAEFFEKHLGPAVPPLTVR